MTNETKSQMKNKTQINQKMNESDELMTAKRVCG